MADPDSLRTEALHALVSGTSADPVGAALALALVDELSGRPARLSELDAAALERVPAFAEEHRVRSITNRVLPGAGGDAVVALAGAIALERRLMESVGILQRASIEVLVLKGSATAQLDHRSSTDRESGDVDLLVRVHQLGEAIGRFEAAGYERKVTHPFRTFTFFHSETMLHPDGTELDIHTRLAQPSRAPRSCWLAPEAFAVGGQMMQAMPVDWRFLHALVHQVMNPPPSFRGLNGLLDLVVLAPRVDVANVRAAADEIGLRAITEHGLQRLAALLDRPITPSRRAVGRLEARVARAFDGNVAVPGYLSLAANLSVLPRRRWASFLGQLLWPAAPYRAELGVTPVSQLRHVIREAAGR